MSRRNQRLWINLQLRTAGLALLTIGILIFRYVYAGGHAPSAQQAGVGQLALTAIAFLCASVGTAAAVVGVGLLDRVEVSDRWTYRPIDDR